MVRDRGVGGRAARHLRPPGRPVAGKSLPAAFVWSFGQASRLHDFPAESLSTASTCSKH